MPLRDLPRGWTIVEPAPAFAAAVDASPEQAGQPVEGPDSGRPVDLTGATLRTDVKRPLSLHCGPRRRGDLLNCATGAIRLRPARNYAKIRRRAVSSAGRAPDF